MCVSLSRHGGREWGRSNNRPGPSSGPSRAEADGHEPKVHGPGRQKTHSRSSEAGNEKGRPRDRMVIILYSARYTFASDQSCINYTWQ